MRQTSFLPCFSARVRVLTMILVFCTVWYKTPAHKPWMQVFRTRTMTC